jgi:HEAT repeat protein
LEQALRGSNAGITALTLISDLREPHYLPVLQEGLSGASPFGNPKFDPQSTRTQILNALTRYFDDAAADIILATAGSTGNAQLRAECFQALETIRKYQDEKGRWQNDRATRAATDTAILDLVALLDDSSAVVRAQALRALATLHATEQMPRIVRMLKDSDENVRKAATEALGNLNAPPPKKD